jgi:hypothetical protein
LARITTNVVGLADHAAALRDSHGTGTFPVQVHVPQGVTASYRIMGRVSPELPWTEIVPARSTDLMQSMGPVPYVAIDVISISGGSITMWVGEQ